MGITRKSVGRVLVLRSGLLLSGLLLLGLVGAKPACAQDSAGPAEPAVPEKAGKELRAFRITGSSPQIDGRLDEEVWAAADAIDDLRTVVQVAYDDRYVYVAV